MDYSQRISDYILRNETERKKRTEIAQKIEMTESQLNTFLYIGQRALTPETDKSLFLEDIVAAIGMSEQSIQNYIAELHKKYIIMKYVPRKKPSRHAISLTEGGKELYNKACQLLAEADLI